MHLEQYKRSLLKAISKYIISLFFISLLLAKGACILATVFSARDNNFIATELVSEQEQEKKGNTRSETGADELFEKALLPENPFELALLATSYPNSTDESLQDFFPDTITPPPNRIAC